MRSTGFLIFSLLIHGICVAALVVAPQRISEPKGEEVEVTMGEPAVTPGVEEAPVVPEPELPPQKKEKPIAKPKAPAKKAIVAAATAALPAKVSAAAPKEESQPEQMDPVIDDQNSPVVVPAAQAEESVKLIPVKDSAPGGVQPAGDGETEAASEDAEKNADPSPVGVTEASTGTTDATKGGATKAGAVSYLDLTQATGNKPPVYPMTARREKRQGEVSLLYRVTNEGVVTDIQVAKSSGFKDLDQEAVRAIGQYRFVPGQEGWARHPVTFAIKGETAPMPSRLRTSSAQSE